MITREVEGCLGHDVQTPKGEHVPKLKELHYCTKLGKVELPRCYETSFDEEWDKKQKDLKVLKTYYPASIKRKMDRLG